MARDSMAEKHTLDYWVAELVKACPTKAPADVRETFARVVIANLQTALPRGRRAENARYLHGRFRDAINKTREGIDSLREAINNDPVGAVALGFHTDPQSPVSLDQMVALLERQLKRARTRLDVEARRYPPPRRGPKNGVAVEIAKMVATEYKKHFLGPPARSRRGDADPPFVRVCSVVDGILRETGHSAIRLSDKARLAGIRGSDRVTPLTKAK